MAVVAAHAALGARAVVIDVVDGHREVTAVMRALTALVVIV